MPGALSLIIEIQTALASVQNAVNNLNTANTAYSAGSLISTTSLQSALTTLEGTVNTAAALQSNNVINGNQ
jgi:hypothetical protein